MRIAKRKPNLAVVDDPSFFLPIHYLVFAGNALEAHRWADENYITPLHFTYVHSSHQLCGLLPERHQVVFCHGYSRNPGYQNTELLQLADSFLRRKFQYYMNVIPHLVPVTPTVRMIRV